MSTLNASKALAKRILGERGVRLAKQARWRIRRRERTLRARIRELGGIYDGRRCFVIGNGPSLTVDDLINLKDEITIGSNGLFLWFREMGFLPTFYTVEDMLVAEDRRHEINSMTGPIKVFPLDLAYRLKADEQTLYLNFLRSYPGFPKFSTRLHDVAYWGGTVTFMNLQLAFYLGCSPVYLIGVDHHYEISGSISRDVITPTSEDVNHFHKDYFGPGYRWHDPKPWRMELAYEAAKRTFESKGRTVENATRGGRLEIFDRRDLDEILSYGASIGTDDPAR